MRNGLGEILDECEERNQGTDGERGTQGRLQRDGSSEDGTKHIDEVGEVAIDRHHDVGFTIGVVGTVAHCLVVCLETCDGFPLVAKGLHHFLSCEQLFYIAVHGSEILLTCLEMTCGTISEHTGDEDHHAGHENDKEGERPTQHTHADEGDADGDEGRKDTRYALPNELAKGIDIVGIDRHDVAMRMGVEIANRQLLHVLEEVGAKTQQGALPHIDHQAVVDIGADDADDEHSSKSEECTGKRCEIRILALGEWDDIVVDEGAFPLYCTNSA